MLGGAFPEWASVGASDERWAPENLPAAAGANVGVFCDAQAEDGKHRVGSVRSAAGPTTGAWDDFSPHFLDLGGSAGGEIDPHLFVDPSDGTTCEAPGGR